MEEGEIEERGKGKRERGWGKIEKKKRGR
jgi:hypothetical protein